MLVLALQQGPLQAGLGLLVVLGPWQVVLQGQLLSQHQPTRLGQAQASRLQTCVGACHLLVGLLHARGMTAPGPAAAAL